MNKLILDSASAYLSGPQRKLLRAQDEDRQSKHGYLTSAQLYDCDWKTAANKELISALWYLTAAAIASNDEKKKRVIEAAKLYVVDSLHLLDTIRGK